MPLTASPLIIEDGSIVSGANSFVSVESAAQFLFDRGLVKQSDIDESSASALLLRGLDAIKRLPCLSAYALPLRSATPIPPELINAQIWAAFYIWKGLENQGQPDSANDPANVAASNVRREKVDVIELEYYEAGQKQTLTVEDMPNVANELIALGCGSLTAKPMIMPVARWV